VTARDGPGVPAGRDGIRILDRVSEPEVIASFLRGELASDRWSGVLGELLAADRRSPSVVTSPDWDDPDENAYRDDLLDRHRAWLQREGLFGGFPHDVEWFRAALSRERVLSVLYIDWDWWLRISGGTRSPVEAARRIRNGEIPGSTAEWHEPIASRLRSEDPPPELIVVSMPDLLKLVLLEGHVRLTAYALFPEYLPDCLDVYLGVSDEMERWSEF
jgi:hypothetical protein